MTGTHERPIFLKPGHNAGDLVESTSWKILTEERGLVEVEAHLPEHLLNPRNHVRRLYRHVRGYNFHFYLPDAV